MKCSKQLIFLLLVSLLGFNIYAGCGSNVNESAIISSAVNTETPVIEGDKFVVDSDDTYYMALEKKLNEELNVNRAPDRCAVTGLAKLVLNYTTDEIQTCSTYDLSKISATAYFSDKTDEVITPAWSIYSGGGTLDGTVYTATNKPAIIVLKALYSENGISKLALFRLTVTGLISISLNKTTDEIQLPAAYDLSTELIVTAKLSNGTTKAIVKGDPNLKWTLASGAGTLVDGVYTPSAKVETATFTANYTENGVTRAAQFKLKVTGLSSLILSKTTDEVNSCETYDLASKIIVSNKLSNGSINDIISSQNLTWVLSSGSGTLDGKIYTAPAKAETAVFTVSYTEAGITKTAQFRLKVTGLSSVVLDKTTDEIMLPATYDLASEIHATAKFSAGESKSVDLIWALSSGSGNLSGSLYTPAAKTETAVFIGSYTESGITKTAQFKLKVIGLSSLILSKTTDEVVSCATYDLNQIIVSDKLSNGTINNITNNTTWKLISGFGTLSGTTYTAPARAETAAFTANYTEAAITKTVQFRLKVIALASIKLSKATDEAQILAPYDLASNIAVTARLSNGQTKPISGNDSNLKWTLSYGSGIISGKIYTPPERIETAVLTATYIENGVVQSAQFRLKSIAILNTKLLLSSLSISQTTAAVQVGGSYNLNNLIIIAKYSNGTIGTVIPNWVIISGGGLISNNIFTAPNNVATIKLMGTVEAGDGSVRSVYFIIKVTSDDPNIIDSITEVVTSAGAILTLKNGITMEIPAASVVGTAAVTLTNYRDPDYYDINQSAIGIYSTADLIHAVIKIPVDDVTEMEATGILLEGDNIKLVPLTGLTDDSNKTYNIPITSPSAYNSPTVLRSATEDRIDLKQAMIMAEKRNIKKPLIEKKILLGDKKGIPIRMPYYYQYMNDTCWAAATLMFIKGHKNLPDERYSTVYNILHDMEIPRSITYKIDFKGVQLIEKKGLIRVGIQWNGNKNLESEISLALDNKPIAKKTWFSNINCLDYIFYRILEGKPVILYTRTHLLLIVGFDNIDENDFLKSTLIVNSSSEEWPNSIMSFEQILDTFNKLYGVNVTPLVTFAAENIIPQSNLQTIQFHDEYVAEVMTIVNNNLVTQTRTEKSGIRFFKNNVEVSKITWDHLSIDGYKVEPSAEVYPFDNIKIECDCYNTDMQDVVCKAKTELYYFLANGSKSQYPIFTNSNPINLPLSIPRASSYIARQYYNETISYVNDIKPNLPVGVSNLVLEIGLYDNNGTKKLDGFNIKFTLSKELTITSAPKHDFIGNNIQYAAKYGDDNVTSSAVWKVMNPDDNVITDGQGVFSGGLLKTTGEISAIKEYNILASYTDPNSHATSTQEVKLKLLPGIIPSKKTFISNVGQSFQLVLGTEIMDDRSTSIKWSVNGVNSTDIYSFLAHENRQDQITARLVKGTMLQTGETLETDLYARATMQVYNMYLDPRTKMIDINEKYPFDLKWDAGQNNTVYFTNQAEWSCSNGTIEITNNRAVYTPSKPGVCVVTAKLAEGTFIRENSNDVITGNDLEFTAEVTVIEIKFAPDALSARSVPIDAMGNPISGFGTSMNFSVLVDGADVKIEDPFVLEGQAKGKLTLLSKSGDKDNLPVYYNFNFDPAVSTQHYYTDNDPIHIKINCIDCVSSSTAGVFLIYRPVKSDVIDTYYPDGRHYQRYSCVQYTTGENSLIHYHGYYYSWYDNAANSLSYDGQFRHGQGIGQHTTYTEFGKISAQWTIQDDYLGAVWYGYAYSEYPYTLISVSQYRLTRSSIYDGWTWTYIP